MAKMNCEMLSIRARLPALMDKLAAMKRAVIALDASCRVCDGSPESVDAVEESSAVVHSLGMRYAESADELRCCIDRRCDRLY
jgi:hypothetical protein